MSTFSLQLSSSTTTTTSISLPTHNQKNRTIHHNNQQSSSLTVPNSSPGTQTHQWMVVSENNSPRHPHIQTVRYRLSQLCKQGQPHLARQLFDSIPRPTAVLWNTIIIGFICNGMPHEAISLYARMKSSSAHPHAIRCDNYTFSAVLKACAETKQLNVGKSLHCHILRTHMYPSKIVCNSLLNMYATTCLSEFDLDFAPAYDLVERVFRTMRRRNVVAWNIMISWYSKTKKFVEAVWHFELMMKFGVKPTVVSFVNAFPAASELKDINTANVLYGLLTKFGDFINHHFAVSSSILMYSELACLDLARQIFDRSTDKNTEVWNSMIGSYVQNNAPIDALDLFLAALESQEPAVVLDEVTFLSALTAASQLQRLEVAQQLHAYIIKSKDSSTLSITVLNAIICLYSRCNCIDDAFKVFNGMLERDDVSWNTMISAFVQKGFDEEGLLLVYEMQKHVGLEVNSVIATALLSAASNLRNQDIGKQTHAYLLRHGIQFEGMGSYLINMYAKCGLIRAAETSFDENCRNCRDQATWNAMIAGYTQNGLFELALIVLRQMIEQHVAPNAVTLSSVLPASSLMGWTALGKQLHCVAIRNFLDKNIFVGSALVDMYSKSGAIAYAESVFGNSPEKNSITYTNMILGYGQHGMGEKAVELFYSMRLSGNKPDHVTFVAVLAACSCNGLVDEGLQIFESMKREYGIQPLAEHYCCVVDMLGRAGRVVEAFQFVVDLGEEGSVSRIWGSLVAACRIHGEFEMGKIVAEKLLQMEGGNSMPGYHVLLSNMYAEEGDWKSVNSLRMAMRETSLTKEVGCSWIHITGHVHCFVSREGKHPKCVELYGMLRELAINMKDAGYSPCLDSQIAWSDF